MPQGLRLNVSPEQGDEYKLVWGCGAGELRPYAVSGERVRRASEDVRRVLNSITDRYRSWEIAGKEGPFDYAPLLSELAYAGENLCEALFTATSGNQISALEARTFISASLEETIPLTIFVSGTPLHVPWGFVFRGDATDLPAARGEAADFRDFWTSLFNISVSFSRTSLFGLKKPSQDSFYLVHALHDKNFSSATSALSADQQKFVTEIINLELGNFTDWISCRKKWRESQDEQRILEQQDPNSIIYIFGHSDGKIISLSEDASDSRYIIDSNGFSATFKKSPRSGSSTICFINGCRTGGGYLGDGFITVTAMHGFQGFIGSEAELSSTFAARFGAEFMRRMCLDGYSVEEAFAELRWQPEFFPLSLLYSCYAEPQFRVRARAGAPGTSDVTGVGT